MNVIFDLGGVVVRWEPDAFLVAVYPEPEVRAAVRAGLVLHPDWGALDRGTLTAAEASRRAARRTGLPGDTIARFLERVPALLTPLPQTVELLRDLRRGGHTLYWLSNMHHAFIDHLERAHDLWDLFAGGVASCRVGHVKPEAAIYLALLGRYALEPATAVFVDDVERNVDAAARVGLGTVHFVDAAQCRRELAACLDGQTW